MSDFPSLYQSSRNATGDLPWFANNDPEYLEGEQRYNNIKLPPLNSMLPSGRNDAGHRSASIVEESSKRGNNMLISNSTLRTASHTELLESGNEAYTSLHEAHTKLYRDNTELYDAYRKLYKQNKELSKENERLSVSYTDLSTRFNALGAEHDVHRKVSSPPPKREDYPHIQYWTKSEFKQYHETSSSKKGIRPNNKNNKLEKRGKKDDKEEDGKKDDPTEYLQYPNGNFITEVELAKLREHLRGVFRDMLNSVDFELQLPQPNGKAPKHKTWSQFGLKEKDYVYRHVYETFPFMRLCENDWKCQHIASRSLSSFWLSDSRRLKSQQEREGRPSPSQELSDNCSSADDEPVVPGSRGVKKRKSTSKQKGKTPKRVRMPSRTRSSISPPDNGFEYDGSYTQTAVSSCPPPAATTSYNRDSSLNHSPSLLTDPASLFPIPSPPWSKFQPLVVPQSAVSIDGSEAVLPRLIEWEPRHDLVSRSPSPTHTYPSHDHHDLPTQREHFVPESLSPTLSYPSYDTHKVPIGNSVSPVKRARSPTPNPSPQERLSLFNRPFGTIKSLLRHSSPPPRF